MEVDLACTAVLGMTVLGVTVAYTVRVARFGRAGHARVEREGKSALLGKGMMEMLCWSTTPVVAACARLGVTPDAITLGALVFGIASGVALATGHFGIGALLAVATGAADAIDGLLARRLGTASSAGEVLDATVDRVVDFALPAGLAFFFRERPLAFVVALLAVLASFMVSYSTAKAEALHVTPPRGSMRRVERIVLLVTAAALTPVTQRFGLAEAPLVWVLAVVAVAGNASAARRMAALRAAVRARDDAEPRALLGAIDR